MDAAFGDREGRSSERRDGRCGVRPLSSPSSQLSKLPKLKPGCTQARRCSSQEMLKPGCAPGSAPPALRAAAAKGHRWLAWSGEVKGWGAT